MINFDSSDKEIGSLCGLLVSKLFFELLAFGFHLTHLGSHIYAGLRRSVKYVLGKEIETGEKI